MDAPIKAVPAPAFAAARAGNQALLVIGVFKLIKASLFLGAALSVFHIVHKDTAVELRMVLHAFRISGDRGVRQAAAAQGERGKHPRKRS